jgi:hypothetical protein
MESLHDGQKDFFTAVIASKLRGLTDEEVAMFSIAINSHDGKSRERCEGRKWFATVRDLFTVGAGREEVHELVREVVASEVNERWERKKSTPVS